MKSQRVTFAHARSVQSCVHDSKWRKENVPPPSKKPLSLKKKRFNEVCNTELQHLSKRTVPQNTSLNTRWAMKNFTDWFHTYNLRNPDNACPEDLILPSCSAEKLKVFLFNNKLFKLFLFLL